MILVANCGGTKTRIGVSLDGQALQQSVTFGTRQNFEEQLTEIENQVRKLTGGKAIEQASAGVAGVWNREKTKLFKSPHLPDWDGKPIKKRWEEIFGCEVMFGNDVEMEGLGEATNGAGRRSRIVVYLAIGTGIGGVKIEDGKVCANKFGFEPGHQIIDVDGEVGYLEDFASGSAMKKIYGKPPEEIDDPDIWEKQSRLITIGIHNAIVMWSPEVVLLGGGLMNKIQVSRLKEMLGASLKIFPQLPDVRMGELGDSAGLYGCLASWRKD